MTPEDSDALAATEVGAGASDSGERVNSPAITPGTKVGRFTVIEKLGEGGMGVVLAAYDPELDRRVAIKMLHDDVSASQGVRLEREAKAMAQLNHPHVVTVHETGKLDDRLYIAMEYVAGQTLRQWLREKQRERDEILDVVMQAGRGLDAAHASGLVHRDFKPDNVLVGKDGRARVSDFGLVAAASQPDEPRTPLEVPRGSSPIGIHTAPGAVLGTPLYMAPEQHDGRTADARADQFSFCVTLWQALSGELPFSADSYEDLVSSKSGGKLRPLPRGARLPATLRAILKRGLATDPSARYPAMGELLAELERWRRPLRWPWLAGGAVVVGGAGVVLALTFGGRADPCAGSEQRLAGIWDAPRRAALAAHFGGDAGWSQLGAALDRYASSWVDRHRDVCRATHVRGEQSAELLDLRMHCLDERLTQFGALVDRFAEQSGEASTFRALDALSSVPALADCDEVARLRDAQPLPADPVQRARLAELERRFAEAASFDRTGNWKKAHELVVPLETQARTIGYAPLVAKLVLLDAGEEFHDGNLDAAVRGYREAAEAAAHARDDERIAQAWTDLVSVNAARGKLADALELVPVARAAVDRVSDRPLLGARLANAIAGIYLTQGKYPDAKVEYERALELVRKDGGDNELVGPALTNFATVQWYVGDLDGAAKNFEAARAWFVARYGPRHPALGYVERDLGDLAAHKDDLDTAIRHYQASLAIFEGAHGPDHIDVAIALEPLCYAYAHSGHLAEARQAGERALALREKKLGADHPTLVQTLKDLSDADLLEGTPASLAQGQARLARALAIAEKAYGSDGPAIPEILDRAAAFEIKLGAPARAYTMLERSLRLRVKAAGDHTNDTALAHMQLGEVEMMLRRYDEAMADYTRAEQIFAAADPKDQDVFRARFGRAQVLRATGHRAEAIELAKAARAAVADVPAAKRLVDEIDGWLAAHK